MTGKFAFIGDCHIGNHKKFGGTAIAGVNNRCREHLDVLKLAIDTSSNSEHIIILGDFFDTSKPEPQVIAAAQEIVDDKPVFILAGNHDVNTNLVGDNALAPLNPVSYVIDSPRTVRCGDLWLIAMPYLVGKTSELLPQMLANIVKINKRPQGVKHAVLAIHAGISDVSTPPYLKDSHDSIHIDELEELCLDFDIHFCFAGNWHQRKVFERDDFTAVQVGALTPVGWKDPGLEGYGAVAYFDISTKTPAITFKVIPGPRFINVKDPKNIKDAELLKKDGYIPYYKLTVPAAELNDALAMVETMGIGNCEVLAESVDGKAEARTAAFAASSMDTLVKSLVGYVDNMTLPEGAIREKVLEKAKEYLCI